MPGLLLSQVLFIRFPWKMAAPAAHASCASPSSTPSPSRSGRGSDGDGALQLVFAVVRVDVLKPNDPNQASGGPAQPRLTWGPVVTDLRCRRDDPDAYLGRQKEEIEVAWDCAQPFGG